MFRAFSRLSSGVQWLQCQPLVLPSYRGDSRDVFDELENCCIWLVIYLKCQWTFRFLTSWIIRKVSRRLLIHEFRYLGVSQLVFSWLQCNVAGSVIDVVAGVWGWRRCCGRSEPFARLGDGSALARPTPAGISIYGRCPHDHAVPHTERDNLPVYVPCFKPWNSLLSLSLW